MEREWRYDPKPIFVEKNRKAHATLASLVPSATFTGN
jgi:hypothetical protein